MAIHTTFSQLRTDLINLMNQVTYNHEIVIIQRDGKEDVAMIAASELSSLLETVHLLRSPANAKRLLSALQRATKPQSLA